MCRSATGAGGTPRRKSRSGVIPERWPRRRSLSPGYRGLKVRRTAATRRRKPPKQTDAARAPDRATARDLSPAEHFLRLPYAAGRIGIRAKPPSMVRTFRSYRALAVHGGRPAEHRAADKRPGQTLAQASCTLQSVERRPLREVLDDEDYWARRFAISSASKSRDVDVLVQGLTDPDHRSVAARGAWGPPGGGSGGAAASACSMRATVTSARRLHGRSARFRSSGDSTGCWKSLSTTRSGRCGHGR